MKIKAILFDVLLPIFTYMLGIVTVILGIIYMIGVTAEEKPKPRKRVTYHGYSRREL